MSAPRLIFGTPVAVVDLPLDSAALDRMAEQASALYCERLERDALVQKTTGHDWRSRPNLLDRFDPLDLRALLDSLDGPVRRFYAEGLGDPNAVIRRLLVRGFARAYKPGQHIQPHTHFDADVVVSIYLQTGDLPGAPASDLILIDPVLRGYPHRAPLHRVVVRRAMAVIFPGYLLHESEPTPGIRIVAGLEYKVVGHDMEKVFNPIESY